MSLPQELVALVKECQISLAEDARGVLSLRLRHRLLLALGPYKRAEGSFELSIGRGYYRRFALAWLTAERTLPFWERRFREDNRPLRLLDLAKSYVRGGANADDLKKRSSELEVSITDMTDEEGGSDQYAGLAAVKVAYVALSDEFFSELDSDDEDTDLDVWSWSPAYTASIAYAGGAPFQESDVSRRREFWRWWLEEGVTKAYEHDKA
jgi:hypothetical protein